MGTFKGPDAFFQPVQQLQVISLASQQGLCQMNVRLNQSRDDHLPGSINDFTPISFNVMPNGTNAVTFNQDITDGYITRFVHGHQMSIFY
jgi:hypothetical protein